MSEKIIHLNEGVIKEELNELVRKSVEDTLNTLWYSVNKKYNLNSCKFSMRHYSAVHLVFDNRLLQIASVTYSHSDCGS